LRLHQSVDPMVVDILPAHSAVVAGSADRTLAESGSEVDTALGQLVNIRRLHLRMPIDAHVAGIVWMTSWARKSRSVLLAKGRSSISTLRATFQHMSKVARRVASASETLSWACSSSAIANRLGGTLGRPKSSQYSPAKSTGYRRGKGFVARGGVLSYRALLGSDGTTPTFYPHLPPPFNHPTFRPGWLARLIH